MKNYKILIRDNSSVCWSSEDDLLFGNCTNGICEVKLSGYIIFEFKFRLQDVETHKTQETKYHITTVIREGEWYKIFIQEKEELMKKIKENSKYGVNYGKN